MRKLYRTPLSQLPPSVGNGLADAVRWGLGWDDFDKDDVREALRKMQSGVCAYCGCKLNADNHCTRIDHFIPRHSPAGSRRVFDWTNFYLSCDRKTTCDSRKKKCTDPIINPDSEDPQDFLAYSSCGVALVKDGLLPEDKKKADNTLRVLGLNARGMSDARIIAFNRMKKNLLTESYMRKYVARRVVEYHSFCVAMLNRPSSDA